MPLSLLILGLYGIFGYHAFYFLALRLATNGGSKYYQLPLAASRRFIFKFLPHEK